MPTILSQSGNSNMPTIEIIGLGPAGEEFITNHTRQRIEAHDHKYLRTSQHPSAHLVVDAITFDSHYEAADSFTDVYHAIVEDLIAAAEQYRKILYAVPGSPLVLEQTVRLLMSDARVQCIINPAMGFLELAWARLRIDPIENAVRLIDGHRFATAAAAMSGPLLIAHCHANWVLSDMKIAAEDSGNISNDDMPVVILHHLGLSDEVVVTVPWSALDHTLEADHLTSVYIAQLRSPVARDLIAFHELARTLRRECPWDREQTHQSLATYLLEETYEVVDALTALQPNDPDSDEHLMEELGDLLYQIEFHAAIAEQEGRFTMGDIARGIHEKLVRRHPHVFDPGPTNASWEEIKRAEKVAKGVSPQAFDGLPQATGSLAYATAVLQKAQAADVPLDFNPATAQSLAKIEDMGLYLLEVVAECRRRRIDPEIALRAVVNIQRSAAEQRLNP